MVCTLKRNQAAPEDHEMSGYSERRAARMPVSMGWSPVAGFLGRALSAVAVAIERSRQRRALAELAARADYLHDIGVSAEQAREEGAKPF
jgi:uncharacterized protein YjiS (DUF1127 family)